MNRKIRQRDICVNYKRSGQKRLGFEQNRTMIKNYFLIHRLVVLTNSIVEFVHLNCFPNFVESWTFAQLALFAEIGIPISLCWVPSADNPAFGTPLIGFPKYKALYLNLFFKYMNYEIFLKGLWLMKAVPATRDSTANASVGIVSSLPDSGNSLDFTLPT